MKESLSNAYIAKVLSQVEEAKLGGNNKRTIDLLEELLEKFLSGGVPKTYSLKELREKYEEQFSNETGEENTWDGWLACAQSLGLVSKDKDRAGQTSTPRTIPREVYREMYSSFHSLLREDKFEYINYLFSVLDPAMEASIGCGFLTITLGWKNSLPLRSLFYERFSMSLVDRYGTDRASKILEGLK